MTATTGPPFELVYQELSDVADISQAVQDLADSVDLAVQGLYDDQAVGAAKPAARMATVTALSLPNNADTTLTWAAGSEYFDNDNMIDNTVTTDRITFTSAGIYAVFLRTTFSATAAGGGVRQISFNHSALGVVARNAQLGTVSDDAAISVLVVIPCYTAGEFIQFSASQNSSAALNVTTRQAQAWRVTTL